MTTSENFLSSNFRRVRGGLLLAALSGMALLAGCATPNATPQRPDVRNWYLIWGEGAKPTRTLYFAQEGLNSSLPKEMRIATANLTGEAPASRRVNLLAVYESTSEADTVYKKLLVDCDQKQYAEEMSFAIYRDDRTSQALQPGSHAMTATWQQRLGQFTCGTMAELTAKNGFLDMGAVPDAQLVEFAWSVPWKDGTRPPYTTTKTKEEVLAQLQQMATQARKQLDDAHKTIDDTYLKGAATPQERLAANAEKENEAYLTANRRAHTFDPMLETWVGSTESQLVTGWGQPKQLRTDGNGDRLLTYLFDHSSVLVNGGGQIVGEAYTQRCWITWRIRKGMALTYGWSGEGPGGSGTCKAMQLDIGQGPHPENRL